MRIAPGPLFVASVLPFVGTAISGRSSASDVVPDYAADVEPILEMYCVGCHVEGDASGGLVMESHADLIAGGESGPALTAGNAESSRMYLMAAGRLEPVMPPDDMEGPDAAELAILKRWIDAGAKGSEGIVAKVPLDVPRVQPVAEISRPVTAMTVDVDGRLITGRFDEVRRAEVVADLSGFGKVTTLRPAAPDITYVGGGEPGRAGRIARIDWSFDPPRVIRSADYHDDLIYTVAVSPDGGTLATGGYDRDVKLWSVDPSSFHLLKDGEGGLPSEPKAVLTGHNGSITASAFSPDGRLLLTGSADETAKVWRVETGERLDTLGQPGGAVRGVGFSGSGLMWAIADDHRFRVWRLISSDAPAINPIAVTRYLDDSPPVAAATTADGRRMVVACEAGAVRVLRCDDWSIVGSLDPVDDVVTAAAVDGDTVYLSMMDGRIEQRRLSASDGGERSRDGAGEPIAPVYLDLGEPAELTFEPSADSADSSDSGDSPRALPRGAIVTATVPDDGTPDRYQWSARRGEVWMIRCRPLGDDAADRLDPMVRIVDGSGEPVVRTRLQAVRDTYFTFRGKDSSETNDFRLFGWREVGLNEYLYAAGEVMRTFMHPRGPDSGFRVYPGIGTRHTYFGTTATTHALGEPGYIVRELAPDEPPAPNGLPVFTMAYENDDDPRRVDGSASWLRFVAPEDGRFGIVVDDSRGLIGSDWRYELSLRAAEPSFRVSPTERELTVARGTGCRVVVRAVREDGYEGPITVEAVDLPKGWTSTFPVVIAEGQTDAEAAVYPPFHGVEPEDAAENDAAFERTLPLVAHADILGRRVERSAGELRVQVTDDRPRYAIEVISREGTPPADGPAVITVARGESRTALIRLNRQEGFDDEVRFGSEDSLRNAPHGVYVDNIGLVGLLVLEGTSEREFFITADEVTEPGRRTVFLRAEDGKVVSPPFVIDVVDAAGEVEMADVGDADENSTHNGRG